jgi:manganese/iron transport system permease protein
LLVFGLLVAPPAAAALFARTVPSMMIGAAALSVFSVWFGLILSYHLGTAASATMALVPVVLFFLLLPVARLRARRRPPVGDHPPAAVSGDAPPAGTMVP